MLPEPNFPARPEQFIGRYRQIEAFEEALRHSSVTRRMTSFAVLGDWGIGKSSLLLKFAAISARPEHRFLPVSLSVGTDLIDYRRLAERLLDKLAETLARSESIVDRVRAEAKNWKLKGISVGGLNLERETARFLSSGSALLSHALDDAWKRFVKPSDFNGAIFLLDDLHNLPSTAAAALAIRDQFQSFGIDSLNYSVCFSAKASYFSGIRSFAEPAVRFYNKLYIAPFTPEETSDYVQAVFGKTPETSQALASWLFDKTLGHPFFLAFISRKLLAHVGSSVPGSPARHWPEILQQLEQEKFSFDLGQVSDRENELLRTLAKSSDHEFTPGQFVKQSDYVYFRRLTDKGLLVRTGRGKYKLYHPLFRLFLQGLRP
ncbi:MAG: hypothetical protein DMG32_11055 [Acidobacteria bacterium]|nr:MAG: hypothetical protein DMG32_11055 [Acidobacteriota bacterium]